MSVQHPDPPGSTDALRLLIRRISYGWYRIHHTGNPPLQFGTRPSNRFDSPAGEFGVLYVAKDAYGAFIETFGHETGRTPLVTQAELHAREISIVSSTRALRLVDLRGEGLSRMGADVALTSGSDYALSRRWAMALYRHRRQPDGILYRARHDPARTCAALFDRAALALTARQTGTLLVPAHLGLLADILDRYGYGLG